MTGHRTAPRRRGYGGRIARLAAALALGLAAISLGGCEGSGSGSTRTSVHVGYYGGYGWYDPYYYRPCCYSRPPAHRPPPSRPPNHRPPTTLPAKPRPTPRPTPRR